MNSHRSVVRVIVLGGFVVAALAGSVRADAELFADDFDAGTSAAGWSVFSAGGDYTADFAFDYSTRGIPAAPNTSGSTTVGLHLTVNNNDSNAAKDAVSLFPIGQALIGDYRLKFDMWLNYNGGAGGGTGSTEFATAGVGHAGTQVVWQDNAASDGRWFAVTGEGGASDDYRVYQSATPLTVDGGGYAAISRNHTDVFYQNLFPSPTYETTGAPGKHWVEVEIAHRAGVIEWRLNGRLIAIDEATLAPGAIMLGYMDTFTSVANPAADNFVLFDNVRVLTDDCDNNGIADAAEVAAGSALDCNCNSVPDVCESLTGGDFDVDGDVDSGDLEAFAACLNGPASFPNPDPLACVAACLSTFDLNTSNTVDLADFADFQAAFTTGPIPPRSADAPTGRQFMAEVAGLSRTVREARILEEITAGNVPGFLRSFVPIHVTASISGSTVQATYYVLPDYLAIGTDADFVRMPMSPLIAQPIADALDALLPTRKMVDDIYAAATVKLAPSPISPTTTDIARATTFYRHHQTVEAQRAGQPLGALIGGIKKDVVITPRLASNPGKVAIYGWHQLSGVPIQPLYLGHVDFYADYSHGIRLVKSMMEVDGVAMSVAAVLAHPQLHVLLSDEGVVSSPRY